MDKSKEVLKYSVMALVFVGFYFLTGNTDVVGSTMVSIILVFIASVIAWGIIREQQKKGSLKASL